MKLRKKIKGGLLAIAFLILLGFLPEWIVATKVDYNKVKQEIKNIIKKSKLSVSYDGIKVSAYSGIIIYQVNVSSEKDFSFGKPFIKAQRVNILYSWKDLLFDKKLTLEKIIIKQAKIHLWVEKDSIKTTFFDQLIEWRKLLGSLPIETQDSSLKIEIKNKKFRKKRLEVKNFNFSYNQKQQFSFELTDEYWGNSKGSFKFLECPKGFLQQKICRSWPSALEVSFQYIPIKDLRWFFKKWNFKSGYISGLLTATNEIQKNNLTYKLHLKGESIRPWINQNDKLFYKAEKLLFNFAKVKSYVASKYRFTLKSTKSKLQLTAQSHKIMIESFDKSNQLWPNTFSLKIEKINDYSNTVLFPYGIKVSGLKRFDLSFTTPSSGYYTPLRMIQSKIEISNGMFRWNGLLFNSTSLEFQIKDNLYEAKLNFIHKKSDLKANLKGKIFTRQVPYYEVLYGTYSDKVYQRLRQLISYQSDTSGSITINNFDYTTQTSFLAYLLKKTRGFTRKSLSKPYSRPRFREEPFFLQNLQNSNVDININIKNFEYSNNKFLPLDAKFYVSNSRARFDVETSLANAKEYIHISSLFNYQDNYPFFMFNYKVKLKDNFDFWRVFFEKGFIKNAKEIEVDYEATTGGDSFGNMYSSWKSDARYTLKGVTLQEFSALKKPKKYDKLSFITKSIGKVGWVYAINGTIVKDKQNIFSLGGKGQWQDIWKNNQKQTQYYWYLNEK